MDESDHPADTIPRNDDEEVTNSLDVKMRMLRVRTAFVHASYKFMIIQVDPNASRFFGKSRQALLSR